MCCERDPEGRAVYNPACVVPHGAEAPSFLRPDATLAVVILSDENDCSTPADQLTGGCVGEACDIEYVRNIECEWYSDRLTPVSEYVSFLQGLKSHPTKLIVMPIVGYRGYTELGNELTYSMGALPAPECVEGPLSVTTSERCCPEGDCVGQPQVSPVCESPSLGVVAYAGARYLQLAEALGEQGLGCPAGSEPELLLNGEQRPRPGSTCVNICTDDYSQSIQRLFDRIRVSLLVP